MKKSTLFAAAMLFMGLSANAQTGFCTAATNADAESTFNWADAQNFCPIITADEVQAGIEEIGMKRDLRVNDTNTHLWIWDGTYEAAEADGLNSFGSFGGYIDMIVTTVGWSGLGFIDDNKVDFSFLNDGGYYLHFGTKGATNAQCIGFCDAKISIGESAFVDNGVAIKNVGNWVNDGEWYYFDIPVATIVEIAGGLDKVFTAGEGGQAAYKSNYFWTLSGGVQGTHIIIENAFLYQKKSEASAINNVVADAANDAIFNLQGVRVNKNYKGIAVKNGKKFIVK